MARAAVGGPVSAFTPTTATRRTTAHPVLATRPRITPPWRVSASCAGWSRPDPWNKIRRRPDRELKPHQQAAGRDAIAWNAEGAGPCRPAPSLLRRRRRSGDQDGPPRAAVAVGAGAPRPGLCAERADPDRHGADVDRVAHALVHLVEVARQRLPDHAAHGLPGPSVHAPSQALRALA